MKRSVKYEINALITTILVIGILLFVYLISLKHPYRYDLTKQKKYSLSEQTTKILKKLNTEVKAIAFFNKVGQEKAAKDLLEEYHYTNPKFTFEFVDPDKNPARAKSYDITLPGVIVLECGDKREKAKNADEQTITNSLLKVTREGKKSVYFLTGHGEMSIDDSANAGLQQLKESLEKEVYEAKTLDFLKEKKVPDNTSVLVIAGPKKPLFKEELDFIKAYIDKGGKVLVLLGADSSKELAAFVEGYGIKVDNGMVIDQTLRMYGADYLVPAVMPARHPIMEGFKLVCFFPMCRGLQVMTMPPGDEVAQVAQTGEKSWVETDMKMFAKGKVEFDPKTDRRGPICVAAAGSYRLKDQAPVPPSPPGLDKKPEEKKARLAVFGSSMAASNAYIGQSGNRDLIMNTIGWLSEEEALISIRAKDEMGAPLSLTPVGMRLIGILTVLFFPAAAVLIGIWVYIRRR
jgi:ABC-type uncharacterized transport system involved in gliding motility auxiliary subunit